MLEYKVISPNRLHLTLEDAKTYLLRDQDPFLSLVRPIGHNTDELDDEYVSLKKSYQDQKSLGAITLAHQKKTDLFPLTTRKRLPVLITSALLNSADLGSTLSKYRLPNFIRMPQKLNDPVIVTWLHSDFELDTEFSVQRSLMYEAYMQFCRVNLHCITNQACFGKSVRGVFPNLQTRRIGVRGNSKYHYFGLRAKPGTTTAEYFTRKQKGERKSIRSLNRQTKLENWNEQPTSDTAVTVKEEPGKGDLRELINILIPDFPTPHTLNVSDTVLKEAKAFLHCSETYAVEVLRAALTAKIKTDFQEVFAATSAYWKTLRLIIGDDTALSHTDILDLMSLCDTKIQAAIRDILLPDLFAVVSNEKQSALEVIFSGIYLCEMMAATEPAPDKVRQLKKHVYTKFSSEMLEQLHFTRLLKKVEHPFENLPVSRVLQRAVMKLDVDYIVSKCRFAYAMKKTSFISIEKQLRQGLSAFHASLNSCFHLRGFLDWVKSCVLNQIQTDVQQTSHKDRVILTLLCFSYAVSLIFNELEKHIPVQLHNGLRNLQLLLTDYICYTVRDVLHHTTDHIKNYKS